MVLRKILSITLCLCHAFSKPVLPPGPLHHHHHHMRSIHEPERSLISHNSSLNSNSSLPIVSVEGCTKYYNVKSGQTCIEVAGMFGLGVDTFMSWNPSVNPPACSNMWAGYGYCVAMTGAAPSSTSAANNQSSQVSACANMQSATSKAVSSSAGGCGKDAYTTYSGDGSIADGWPSMGDWVDFDCMFESNRPLMQSSCSQWAVTADSAVEVAGIKNAIKAIAAKSGIDSRFILAIMMQESEGCVRVITTNYGVRNPGLMQSHNGNGTCNSAGVVQNPCPYSEIFQMISDGTMGTVSGDGLVQCMEEQGHTDTSRWYRTARMYNGGIIQNPENLDEGCCTSSYASDIANRLTGWTTAPRNFTG